MALAERDRLIAQMDQALLNWDVWLCPVAATTAFTHHATFAEQLTEITGGFHQSPGYGAIAYLIIPVITIVGGVAVIGISLVISITAIV